MEKRIRIILFIIIFLLLISNIVLLFAFYLRPNTCLQCSAPIEKAHHKEKMELLHLNKEQKSQVKIIWNKLKDEGEPIVTKINSLNKELINEISSTNDPAKVDSLETEIANLYRQLIHNAGQEYHHVASILNNDQIKTLNCVYFDLFLRVYNLPMSKMLEDIK